MIYTLLFTQLVVRIETYILVVVWWNQWKAKKQLYIPLFQRILIIELKPIVKVFINLIVRLSRYIEFILCLFIL